MRAVHFQGAADLEVHILPSSLSPTVILCIYHVAYTALQCCAHTSWYTILLSREVPIWLVCRQARLREYGVERWLWPWVCMANYKESPCLLVHARARLHWDQTDALRCHLLVNLMEDPLAETYDEFRRRGDEFRGRGADRYATFPSRCCCIICVILHL